jgi:hypothetical protein
VLRTRNAGDATHFSTLDANFQAIATTILDGNVQIATVINRRQDATDVLIKQSHESVISAIAALSSSHSTQPFRSNAPAVQLPAKKMQLAQVTVLDKLTFRNMYDREGNVTPAHYAPFKWILSNTAPPGTMWSSLIDFLLTGNGIYRICGKAASGKSTLIKWLMKQPEIWAALMQWAGGRELKVPSFLESWY